MSVRADRKAVRPLLDVQLARILSEFNRRASPKICTSSPFSITKSFPPKNLFLSAASSAALYGKGVFTTVAIYDSKPFLWEKHWRRLARNAEKIGVDLSAIFRSRRLKIRCSKSSRKNNLTNGRARITFFDETASRIWQTNRKTKRVF
ncbi:MAG: hypothetical protein WKF71_11730 [Pyrinomonadaceae bacterium]